MCELDKTPEFLVRLNSQRHAILSTRLTFHVLVIDSAVDHHVAHFPLRIRGTSSVLLHSNRSLPFGKGSFDSRVPRFFLHPGADWQWKKGKPSV